MVLLTVIGLGIIFVTVIALRITLLSVVLYGPSIILLSLSLAFLLGLKVGLYVLISLHCHRLLHGTDLALECVTDLVSRLTILPLSISQVDVHLDLMCKLHAGGERVLFEYCMKSISKSGKEMSHSQSNASIAGTIPPSQARSYHPQWA
jgi:hypothetical protein